MGQTLGVAVLGNTECCQHGRTGGEKVTVTFRTELMLLATLYVAVVVPGPPLVDPAGNINQNGLAEAVQLTVLVTCSV